MYHYHNYPIIDFWYFSKLSQDCKSHPIFKKENNKLITNYRPISLLPVISKIFETVISEQLSDYFLTNNLLCPQQYGFKKNSSTELAALELLDRVLDQNNGYRHDIR